VTTLLCRKRPFPPQVSISASPYYWTTTMAGNRLLARVTAMAAVLTQAPAGAVLACKMLDFGKRPILLKNSSRTLAAHDPRH
jgi:hypothetical protein